MKLLLLVLIFNSAQLFTQGVSGKQEELTKLREEIKKLEEEIKTSSLKQKDALQLLEKYNRQNFLLNKLIVQLKSAQIIKQFEIVSLHNEIRKLNEKNESLKRVYAKYVVLVYKQLGKHELQYLIDAKSYKQAILRYKYLNEFSRKGEILSEEIKSTLEILSSQSKNLKIAKEEESIILNEKQSEENRNVQLISEKKKFVDKLKKDQSVLKKELDTKKKFEKKIEKIIGDLIAAEEANKKTIQPKEKTDNTKPNTDVSESFDQTFTNFASFSAQKGKLSWPVKKGKVIRKFGEDKNQSLKTVTLNYGIDIKAEGDMSVKSVAEGVVSIIEWIPGYGTVIIITHKGGYRTVLGHVKNVNVDIGAIVKIGQKIGEVSESVEGNIVHFEIWHERNFQNPEVWLAKK